MNTTYLLLQEECSALADDSTANNHDIIRGRELRRLGIEHRSFGRSPASHCCHFSKKVPAHSDTRKLMLSLMLKNAGDGSAPGKRSENAHSTRAPNVLEET